MRFLLWDQPSWVKNHPNAYGHTTQGYAKRGERGFAKQQFFVECLNPVEELLWFGDLIKYQLLRFTPPKGITTEETQKRQQILSQLGTAGGLACSRDGILTPNSDFSQ